MLLGFNCKINCWECPRDCEIKKCFQLPEPIFNYAIMDIIKPIAGFEICKGMEKEIVDERLKITVVSLYIARKKYLENT